METTDKQQAAEDNRSPLRSPFPPHLRRAAGSKEGLTDEDADRELEEAARVLEQFVHDTSTRPIADNASSS